MATALSFASATPHLHPHRRVIFQSNFHSRVCKFRCSGESPTSNSSTKPDTEPENVLLKMAWYGSELLGITASFFRSPSNAQASGGVLELPVDVSGAVDRAVVVETIKEDFQRSYFVTGNLTLNAYEEDCEFADPAGSFRGLRRFKRNCTNFGSLIEKSNMKLMKWEDFEDKGIGHWRFSCVLSFPWKPILSGPDLPTGNKISQFFRLTSIASYHNIAEATNWSHPQLRLAREAVLKSCISHL